MKMFLVETLLNFVFYVRNILSKSTEVPFPVYYYIYYCSNDTRIHGQNAQWSDKFTEISKPQRSALFFHALSFYFDFSSLKPLTEI